MLTARERARVTVFESTQRDIFPLRLFLRLLLVKSLNIILRVSLIRDD
jgi:hypothetical protein